MMRVAVPAVITLITITAGLLGAMVVIGRRGDLPAVDPSVEPICAEAMQHRAPDLTWVTPHRQERGRDRDREATTVALGELPLHQGSLVRVAGVLHAEFEWVALYPSRGAMEQRQPEQAPWVTLDPLWPDEGYLLTKAPSISDRCVVIEGTYSGGAGGHLGMFSGTIADVRRLDVWSTPHRPFITTPTPP